MVVLPAASSPNMTILEFFLKRLRPPLEDSFLREPPIHADSTLGAQPVLPKWEQ